MPLDPRDVGPDYKGPVRKTDDCVLTDEQERSERERRRIKSEKEERFKVVEDFGIKTEKISDANHPNFVDLTGDNTSDPTLPNPPGDDDFVGAGGVKVEDTSEAGSNERPEDADRIEFYEWEMKPKNFSDDLKTGVSFKGDSAEYISAHEKISNLLDQSNSRFTINDRKMTVLKNGKNKPLRVEVKTLKGSVGKVNLKFYSVNSKGSATITISKVSEGTILHVKTLAFKVIKYLIDGIVDGEISDDDLKTFKEINVSGKNPGTLLCQTCKKTFKTINGLNIHCKKFHAVHQCEICKETLTSISTLDSHKKLCQMAFNKTKIELVKVSPSFTCDMCLFKSSNESDIHKHKKEIHESTPPSPKQKKAKQEPDNVIEDMEVDEVNDLKEDSYTSKKREKREKREKKLLKKKQKKIESVKKLEEDKKKSDKKIKKQQKKEAKLKLKPYLKEVPPNCKSIVGEDYILYPVKGDGACAPRCLAAWIFQDQTLGPYVARDLNTNFVNNWDYWKDKFEMPFIREVGNGRKVECKDEKELLDFLSNSEDGAYMWRDHEDFSLLSSLYQCNIKIITISGQNDPYPKVNMIEPNPELKSMNKYPKGYVPDLVLLHEKDLHYNLIIPKNSRLAMDGGLDFQRNESAKESNVDLKDNGNKENLIDNDQILLKHKLAELEAKCQLLENRVTLLENENKYLKGMLDMKNKSDEKEDTEVLLKYKNSGSKRLSPQVPNENKRKLTESPKGKAENESKKKRTEFSCEKCDFKCESDVALNSHEKAHPIKKNCDQCEAMFWTKPQLENHVRRIHEGPSQPRKDYNCNDCFFQGENSLELKNHTERTRHSPGLNSEKCFTCDKEFPSYWNLMNHRKAEHPSAKKCRYFAMGQCKFDDEVCWYSHVLNNQKDKKDPLSENTCKECNNTFLTKTELMKHKKKSHKDKIQTCRKYSQGNCSFDENSCWYSHDAGIKNEVEGAKIQDKVFCEEKEKIPPDQMENIYTIISHLSSQVEKLMMRSPMETQ